MPIIIMITAQDSQQAQKIARALLAKKLIACANILPGVQSLFWWQGKIDCAQEVLMILKAQKKYFSQIVRCVKTLHSYEVPEIIALPIVAGDRAYIKWLHANSQPQKERS